MCGGDGTFEDKKGNGKCNFFFALLAVFSRLIKPQIAKGVSVSQNPKWKLEQILFSFFKTCHVANSVYPFLTIFFPHKRMLI